MVAEVIALGWILIVIGVILLLLEAFNPGFFLAVPGTTLIIIGAVSLLFPEIFSSSWIILIGILTALSAAGITVWIYSKIASGNTRPFTSSRDSLIGKKGIVVIKAEPDNISGKVRIDNVDWSAKTTGGFIDAGKKVKVTDSEGVHVIVEEELN
ncbi:NfeD family protein [Methanomicrobium antiquum]|uniref:NfeD family protein n=1 Tax=Methanomicrobium antiquum TaxID=487686 RepID=A0AAF0JNL5_9EURY|nr:NfeD family protein [Methanomicrobium antiquum]MDD3976637.1 NfeD family protein [Methanomicrobium sp.]WFN37705.1 NfeD family protein [Methanomicrobium antiquum]